MTTTPPNPSNPRISQRSLDGEDNRNRFLRECYENAVQWYHDEGSERAHRAVLAAWQRWANYAAEVHRAKLPPEP